MKEDNVLKPYNTVEARKVHEFIPKFVAFEEIFQLVSRINKLNKTGDKEDIYEYSNEYINSRLDTLQPHMGMFKRVDETIVANVPATQVLPLMEIGGRFILTQYSFYFIVCG